MKLYELKKALSKKGTYVGVKFDSDTIDSLVEYMHEANIPNRLSRDRLHSTILYSRKECPNIQINDNVDYIGTPIGFDVWDTDAPDGGRSKCLVLKFDCPDMVKRHNHFKKTHGATHDFDKYEPHITLSYNIGNVKPSSFPDVEKYLHSIRIINEYIEQINVV